MVQTSNRKRSVTISSEPVIRSVNLSKRVTTSEGMLDILSSVDLTIKLGETVAIIGVSGSGKSTLLSLLAGLDTPTSGTVELAGAVLTDLDEDGRAELRSKNVGFVFQSFQLLPSLTALENVMLPLELAAENNPEQTARSMLERVELSHRLTHYPKQLSGGEQQRVALARAFVTQPKILFADEPTGNLDSKTGHHIIDLLFELNHERSTTLVLVTHDEALASRCDRKIHLDGGRITP
ncbi:MAG: ABC transporter ATP-binding protein [Pseudomonadota bacterium]